VDRDESACVYELCEEFLPILAVAVEKHDLGAVAAGRLQFARRGVLGHKDDGGGFVQAGGERECLGVVAAADGGHSAFSLVGRQRRDRVVGAAELERADALEVFGFEECGRSCCLVDRAGGDGWRPVRDAFQSPCGLLDVVEGDHRVGGR
jgi:hypothetical protein